jgi:hypothetical protein
MVQSTVQSDDVAVTLRSVYHVHISNSELDANQPVRTTTPGGLTGGCVHASMITSRARSSRGGLIRAVVVHGSGGADRQERRRLPGSVICGASAAPAGRRSRLQVDCGDPPRPRVLASTRCAVLLRTDAFGRNFTQRRTSAPTLITKRRSVNDLPRRGTDERCASPPSAVPVSVSAPSIHRSVCSGAPFPFQRKRKFNTATNVTGPPMPMPIPILGRLLG